MVESHDPGAYGEAVGPEYDLLYPEEQDALETDATVGALARLAGPAGSVLELGLGTGRLALGLLDHGLRVAGIEASAEMVAKLRAKPRGEEIEVVVGDFARARARGPFSVVALTFNTVFALPDRRTQVECFGNAARHLVPGGCFVIEAFVLRPDDLRGEWSVRPRSVQHDHVELQFARYDPATQRIERTLAHLRPEGIRFVSVTDNYAWPGELDLMAGLAGLRLRSRDGGWRGEPYDAASHRHVTVYEKPDVS